MTRAGRNPFVWLCAVGFVTFTSYDIARHPIVPLFARSLGAGPEWIGLIVAISTITGIILKWPAGVLSDRIGRPRVIFAALAVASLVPFVYPGVTQVWHLLAIRLVHGLVTALFAPTAMATVADLATGQLGESLGWYSAVTQSGRLTGRVVGGYSTQFAGFGLTYMLAGLVGVTAWLLFILVMPRQRTAGRPPQASSLPHPFPFPRRGEGGGEGLTRRPWQDTRLLLTSMMQAGQMLASGALEAFLPIYAVGVGIQPGAVGLLFGLHAGASLMMKPAVGRLSDRIGRPRLVAAGLLLTAATFFFLPFLATFARLMVLMVVLGTGEAVTATASSAMVADLAGGIQFGSAMGGYGAIMDVGHAGGPIVAGLLVSVVGMKSAFLLISAGLAGLAVLFYMRVA